MAVQCPLVFEPFRATRDHETHFDEIVAGNIYGQSTERVEMPDGSCKYLLARPVIGADGNIAAMTCNCPDGSVITAEPTWDARGNVIWHESLSIRECHSNTTTWKFPASVTLHRPCSITSISACQRHPAFANVTYRNGVTAVNADPTIIPWLEHVTFDLSSAHCFDDWLSVTYRARTTDDNPSGGGHWAGFVVNLGQETNYISFFGDTTSGSNPIRICLVRTSYPGLLPICMKVYYLGTGRLPIDQYVRSSNNVHAVFLRGKATWGAYCLPQLTSALFSDTLWTLTPGSGGRALSPPWYIMGRNKFVAVRWWGEPWSRPIEGVDYRFEPCL